MDYHLSIFNDRSELSGNDGVKTEFLEGPMDEETKQIYQKISQKLEERYLEDIISKCKITPNINEEISLSNENKKLLEDLVDSMTSEVGRALIGLTFLQLTIKSIAPNQSIRLHKGNKSKKTFGWKKGISMRSLDAEFITPTLRKEGLLKINSFGIMMTRTLAENYPYTKVYKASIKGAKDKWLDVVDALENASMDAASALKFLIIKLLNIANLFQELADNTLHSLKDSIQKGNFSRMENVLSIMNQHMQISDYSARIMEISMHSLMQAVQERRALLPGTLVPLSQMRSANKKHGNIGDIEIKEEGKIIEAWDAKYGKPYLRDELEELSDKLENHDAVDIAGFVTSEEPLKASDLEEKITEIQEIHGVSIKILTFDDWVKYIYDKSLTKIDNKTLSQGWILAYTESLAQKRRELAPIDEPCYNWLLSLNKLINPNKD